MKREDNNLGIDQPEGVPLFAIAGPGSLFHEALYSFSIGGWSVDDQKFSLRLSTTLPADFDESHVYTAIGALECLLLAIFVNDHSPRRIFHFDHPRDLSKETGLELMSILGQCGDPFRRETGRELAIKSFGQAGWIFTHKPAEPMDVLPSVDEISEWFDLFVRNSAVAASIGLIQESFAALNEFSTSHRYHDYLALSKAIILMVSGLESLFFSKSDDRADIAFKFRLVGAMFYERFVAEDYLRRFGADTKKLKFVEMKKLLGRLYDIRSMIAHGNAQSVLKGNDLPKWNRIFELLRVAPVHSSKKSAFLRNIVLALGLLQKHLLALIACSKENLAKGAAIVDEIFPPYGREADGKDQCEFP